MSSSAFATENAKISSAALHLAAKLGWEFVTLETVAKQAGISLTLLKKRFVSPSGLICVIAQEIDRAAFAATGKITGAPHDKLFDLLMARFDILQKNRKAILSIAEAANSGERDRSASARAGAAATARRDRKLSCALGRATWEGSYRLIDAVRLETPPRLVLAAGLAAVYGWAFLAWRRDESRDLAKTMAALDRALRHAGKAAAFFTPRS